MNMSIYQQSEFDTTPLNIARLNMYLLPNAIEQMMFDIAFVMSSCGSKAVLPF